MEDYKKKIEMLFQQNEELAKQLQLTKQFVAERDNDNLLLIKENNELKLKISMFRRKATEDAQKLDAAIQSAGGEMLSHIVQASNVVTRLLEHSKSYVSERLDLDSGLPRWSTLTSTPVSEKINVVPPMLIGGRLIQPVVSLSRTLITNNSRSPVEAASHTPTGNMPRAFPAHMLQEVYIPLTRIDATLHTSNTEADMEVPEDDNDRDINEDIMSESQNRSEEFPNRLESVFEYDENEETPTQPRPIVDPMEGPSWLLDQPNFTRNRSNKNLEPDSTTELEEGAENVMEQPNPVSVQVQSNSSRVPEVTVCEFSPTVRRRKCVSPPPPSASPYLSPIFPNRPHGNRVLKVLIPKMKFDMSPAKRSKEEQDENVDRKKLTPKQRTHTPPPNRLMPFDAPSPNGSTDSRVIVIDDTGDPGPCTQRLQTTVHHTNTNSESTTQRSEDTQENHNVTTNKSTENSSVIKRASKPTKRKKTKDSDTQTEFFKKSKSRSKKDNQNHKNLPTTSQSTQMKTDEHKTINQENTNDQTINDNINNHGQDNKSKSNHVQSRSDIDTNMSKADHYKSRFEHDNVNSRSRHTNDNRNRTERDTASSMLHSKYNDLLGQDINNSDSNKNDNRNNRSKQSGDTHNNPSRQSSEDRNNQIEDNRKRTDLDSKRPKHSRERDNRPENDKTNRDQGSTSVSTLNNERDSNRPEHNNPKQSNRRGQSSQQQKVTGEPRKDSNDSDDSSENDYMSIDGRTRRLRRPIIYTEKPLNRKLRR